MSDDDITAAGTRPTTGSRTTDLKKRKASHVSGHAARVPSTEMTDHRLSVTTFGAAAPLSRDAPHPFRKPSPSDVPVAKQPAAFSSYKRITKDGNFMTHKPLESYMQNPTQTKNFETIFLSGRTT